MKVDEKLRIVATLDMSEEEIIQLIAKLENVIREIDSEKECTAGVRL